MKKRVLMALVIALLVFAAVYASAASLNVSGGFIQAGSDLDLTCTESVQVAGWGLETDDNTVRSVRLNGVPAACDGAEMFVRIVLDGGAIHNAGSRTLSGTETTNYSFQFPAPHLNPVDIVGINVYIEGAGG